MFTNIYKCLNFCDIANSEEVKVFKDSYDYRDSEASLSLVGATIAELYSAIIQ